RSKAYSLFQSKVINGYADPYSYGSFPGLISGARFTWHAWDISTELFFSTRLEVRERPGQPPFVGCGEPCADPFKQIPSPSPEDANLDKRQLGEQAFEELTIPYSSWTGHTKVCIYGHSIYSGGDDFTPVSEADCDAL